VEARTPPVESTTVDATALQSLQSTILATIATTMADDGVPKLLAGEKLFFASGHLEGIALRALSALATVRPWCLQ